jgi:hypothetical protein
MSVSMLSLSQTSLLILYCDVNVKQLEELGKKYPWPRLLRSPCCGGRLWRHGFVPRYFDLNGTINSIGSGAINSIGVF